MLLKNSVVISTCIDAEYATMYLLNTGISN